jgi:hypothetical protein
MTTPFFQYHKAKVIQGLRYHYINRKEIKIMLILVNVFSLLTAILYFMGKITPKAFVTGSLLWFMMMILFWMILPRLIYSRSAFFKGTYKLSLDNHHFSIETAEAGKQWNWNEFSNWMESPHFFHIYLNSKSFFIIPKDAFEDEQETAARKLFKENIGGK